MLTPDQKGAVAEAAITYAAIRLGIEVYRPLQAGGRYDLIFDLGTRLLRVQCKWACRNDVIVINCRSCRRGRDGYIRRTYSAEEVDAIAAYCSDIDRCYLLFPSSFVGHPMVQLRLSPPRNNQRRRINWAEDFEFEATIRGHFGAIAQLGERLRGTQEVAGSSPAGSTCRPTSGPAGAES
jgi:hypothetical protein